MGIAKGRRGGVRSKLVEPYFQIKLGLVFVIVNLIFSILIGSLTYSILTDVFAAVKTYFELSGSESVTMMGKFTTPMIMIGFVVVLFVATTIFVAVHYTYKFYGPLISINRFVDDLIEGKSPNRLVLRDGDELQELASKLNVLAEKLNKIS
jgi:signal transduction histidine kinase